jgi:RNA polymerase sigma-70 factor (family 1)
VDKSIFRSLFVEHYRPLCNFAYRITGDIDQAEDIVQDVFVKLWNTHNLLQKDKNIRSYIYTMVRNHALEIVRRQGIGARINKEILYLHTETSEEQMDDEDIEKYRLIDKIYVSIRQLPPKCSEVFTLSKVNGLTYTQIADRLDISVKTVENHIGKALKLLREMLAENTIILIIIIIGLY